MTASRTTRATIMPIAFVAGGPGDPELVSVRGADLLGKAELVLADEMAGDIVARHANKHAEVVLIKVVAKDEDEVVEVAPRPEEDSAAQEESTATPASRARIMVQAAREGRRVVRLFTGDPVFDGRISPEVSAVVRSKVP
ncbi:MAG: hypothetical protein FJW50_05290, partial [Actinobacteria bacterium]|nr:hypothetical protein [Actinomycetota bacterium]